MQAQTDLQRNTEQFEEALLRRPERLPHLPAGGVGLLQGTHQPLPQISPQLDSAVIHHLLLWREVALQLHELSLP